MKKTKRSNKTNKIKLLVFKWLFAINLYDYILHQPKDYTTDTLMILFPFFLALLFKSSRTFIWALLKYLIKSTFISLKFVGNKNTQLIDMYQIDQMEGLEFEHILKPIFERKGYVAEVTKGSGDYGADLILRKGTKKFVVQAKRYNSNIGVKAVQQVVPAVKHYNANGAIVITNQYFTPAAVNLAKSNSVKLIDRKGLIKMIR
ncbi:restriction endonuclease [Rummeliibacillus sp. NPDC094406]|uniref:restriction endonuclease n=1 Tax=Rummeliibacillus sp. NPDC094406 TaxID=3364511 RepID=UPI00380AA7F6